MATTAPVAPYIACAEAIAFLHLLHIVPTKPSINPQQPQAHANSAAYSLPFDVERDLVNTLAFLSNISEDPNHVPALCMREKPGTDASEVIIAVNQVCCDDGLCTLKAIENGFESIFRSLSGVLQTHDTKRAVFTSIVSMCSLRISERMRYAPHKRKKSKQPFKQLLEQASESLKNMFPKQAKAVTEFRRQAKAVAKTIDTWLEYQSEQRLCDVVEAVFQLSRSSDLSQMLSSMSIPNTLMGPSERSNLLRMIQRVARYRDVAGFLYRTAKKYAIVRGMKTVLVSLPQDAFRSLPIKHQPDLFVTCKRLQIAHEGQSDAARVARLLDRDGQTAQDLFSHQCAKTLRKGKVHAEMQLIYYLETHRPKPVPRVVASSKMACFLCNVFLCQAANMYTKRCHGRIYPAWKLPVLPAPCRLECLFVQALDNYIRNSVTTLLSRQHRTFLPQPSESTLWTMVNSATTADTLLGSRGLTGKPLRPESRVEGARKLLTTQVAAALEVETATIKRRESNTSVVTLWQDLVTARQGTRATVTLGVSNVAPVQAGPLLIQLEYTVDKNNAKEARLECELEWLTREDADAAKVDGNVYIVDVRSLGDELAIPTSKLKSLCIAIGEDIVRLKIKS